MKILFISKRRPQQRDLIERPFGRFYHLPTALAMAGHDVRVQLCSHHSLPSFQTQAGSVTWNSYDIRTLGTGTFFRTLRTNSTEFQPDWVVGVSDAQYGLLAHRIAMRCRARLVVDAYDNYEAYMPWNFPLHWLWRRSVASADIVTAAGPQLAARLQRHRPGRTPVKVLPMAADPGFFKMDRAGARKTFNLPVDAPLIGYSGGWARNRGTDVLIESFRLIRKAQPDIHLVISGHPPKTVREEPGVITVGYLEDAQLPLLLNALDVACVITANTAFGRYSYPAKLCEAMACNVPVVATATEPVRWMLQDDSRFLAEVGNAQDIAARILSNLDMGRVDYGARPTWSDVGKRLEALLTH
jgi:glycosyltransferase involved in cell wall biosynthesis